ncbi:hypothetical protein JCM11957_06820 [Caminibacter profundus]
MIPLIGMLADAGMSLLSSFIDKGKDEAVKFIKDKTGIDLNKKGNLTKEDLQKLKEFEIKNKELILQKLQMYLADKQNAREMNTNLSTNENVPIVKKIYPEILATIVVIATFVMFYLSVSENLTGERKEVVMLLLGMLNTALGMVLSFYFGSSIGSKDKDAVLARIKK